MKKVIIVTLIVGLATILLVPNLYKAEADIGGSSLIGWWNMDNNTITGTNMNDLSGYGNTAAMTGTATSTGKMGQGRSFNGLSDYITPSNPTNFQTANVTETIWFSTTASGSLMAKQQERNNNWPSYALSVRADNHFVNFILSETGQTNNVQISNSKAMNDGKWHMAAGTYDGSYGKLYIDGKLVATSDLYTLGIGYNGDPLFIGKWRNGGPVLFEGKLDSARVYNRALTANDIAQLYNLGFQRFNSVF